MPLPAFGNPAGFAAWKRPPPLPYVPAGFFIRPQDLQHGKAAPIALCVCQFFYYPTGFVMLQRVVCNRDIFFFCQTQDVGQGFIVSAVLPD